MGVRAWRGETYGEVHHAGLGRLLDVLALGDLGVGVELHRINIFSHIHSKKKDKGGKTYVEQLIIAGPGLDLAGLCVDFVELCGDHVYRRLMFLEEFRSEGVERVF